MAERSFAREVEDLKLGAGQEFRGEGILAITKALLECGVSYVAGYQGAPISHLMDVLSDAQDILSDLGVHFESSASEATAAATLAASVMYPIRGAVTFKSPVGINVASDALANLSSGGVTGGALIIIGEDYGEGSSIMQERSHAFAMKSQLWLVDPRPNVASIVKAVHDSFELSEASNTPVMLEVRIRACHVHGRFATRDNVRPSFPLARALDAPSRDTNRIVLPPASFLHEKEKIEQRWPAAVEFIHARGMNETFDGDIDDIGIIMQGGMYNGVITRAARGRPCRYLGRDARAALCDERHLPDRRPRGDRVLPRQEGGADGRGGPARIHRAGAAQDPAQRRHSGQAARQGPVPDGRRIHRAGHGRGDRRLHPPLARGCAAGSPRARRTSTASRSTTRSARWPTWCRRGRRASAPAARSGRSFPR